MCIYKPQILNTFPVQLPLLVLSTCLLSYLSLWGIFFCYYLILEVLFSLFYVFANKPEISLIMTWRHLNIRGSRNTKHVWLQGQKMWLRFTRWKYTSPLTQELLGFLTSLITKIKESWVTISPNLVQNEEGLGRSPYWI